MTPPSVFSRPMNEVLDALPQRARFQTEAYLEAAEIVGEVRVVAREDRLVGKARILPEHHLPVDEVPEAVDRGGGVPEAEQPDVVRRARAGAG